MKKGWECIGVVERVDFPNIGIVKTEEGIVYIKGVLPGQTVRAVVNKCKKGKAEGGLLEVIKVSELQTENPPCLHFGLCGGCTYQTLSYEAQLKLKQEQVKRLLDEVISEEYDFLGIKESPKVWGYKNKMEFSFGDEVKGGPLALGLHKKGSFYDLVSVSDCKIVHEDYNRILRCVLDFCSSLSLSFFHRMTHEGYLRHLVIRRGDKTGDILIVLVTTSLFSVKTDEEERAGFAQEGFLKELVRRILALKLDGSVAGILHTVNDSVADVVRNDRTDVLFGRDYFYEELLGLTFKVSAFSFFQTNSTGAEVLYSMVREFVGETRDKLIFDLYSGTGTIAQLLAPVAKKVVGVEIIDEAVEAARENAALNRLDNCEFIAGDVLKVVDTLPDKPDLIVLDPPRDGVNPKALLKIIDFGVERIVYISCKPTSLSRDLILLQEKGYRVKKIALCDMFPGGVHVETVVLLERKDR